MEKMYIPPNELRKNWDYVRAGLLKIQDKSPEYWIPEDVYTDCFTQKALLWIFMQDDRKVGFAVLQPKGETLHVWCGYSEEHKYFLQGWEQIQEIAKANGAKNITFDSWRRGWEKVAKQIGFKPRKWIKEL